MSSLEQHYLAILQGVLEGEFLPNLPPLLDQTRPADEQQRKNLSRAFSAFALHKICRISQNDAAQSVVDDFDDYGIDAIYYHALTETFYLVQSKFKPAQQFSQEEALAFCQGVRKLITQDFDGFNQNVQNRQLEIEGALENCNHIQLVVAHIGSGVSIHAKQVLDDLVSDEDHGEERLKQKVIVYDSNRIVVDLRVARAYERVDTGLSVQKCTKVTVPRETYFGLVKLEELVRLHEKYGKALYEKNIRTFLGHKTEVNASIQQTLATKPQEFLYLNNGVTALCQEISPKNTKKDSKRLILKGFSVINGAQTIASSAKFLADNKGKDISTAKVSLTLIKANSDGDFGKAVTRARNHQNPVLFSNFAALDDEQERLRRELSYLGIHYAYKAEGPDGQSDPSRIRIEEAAQALALLQVDPRYVVWLKKEPARLLDMDSSQYKELFSPSVTAFRLLNAVLLNRYIQSRMITEAKSVYGRTRLVYKHGNYALAWVFAKRVNSAINAAADLNEAKLRAELSAPFDLLRQTLWNKTEPVTILKGPLAFFRNQTDTVPLLEAILIEHFGLEADPVVTHKKQQQKMGQPYPEALFAYLVSKAPQIGNLA